MSCGSIRTIMGHLFMVCLILILATGTTHAQVFSNDITDPAPYTSNPFIIGQVENANISASGIGRGSGISGNAGSNRYNTVNWGNASLDVNKYFTFTITPDAGYLVNYSSFNFTLQRSSAGSPSNFNLRSSLDGFATNIDITVNYTGTSSSGANFTISLAAASFQNVTTAIEFRLYGYSSSNTGATCSVNDFIFNGTVLQAPTLYVTDLTGFGDVCINTVPGTNAFDITGVNLTTANVTIGPLSGYQFSTNNSSFFNSLSLAHAAGSYAQTIYVKFLPTSAISYAGNISVGGGGASTVSVPVTGSGVNTKPELTDGSVSAITTNSAVISANITATGCSAISGYGIEYSTTPGFANGSGTSVPSGNLSGGLYSVSLSSLITPGTTFYFHTYATNNGGTTYGTENSFTLLPVSALLSVPVSGSGSLAGFGNVCINTGTVTNNFKLNGYLLNGTNISIGPLAGFSFSTNSGGPFNNTLVLTSPGSGYSYTSGTLSGCTIYVRFSPLLVQSYNGNIPISGGGAPAISVPVTGDGVNTNAAVVTGSAIFINTDGATLQGEISNPGCGTLLSYGFEYSTVSGFTPGTGIQVPSSNLGGSDFSVSLTGLSSNTMYYYYAYLTNSNGTIYGAINSFLTGTVPTALCIQLITPTSPTALAPFTIKVTAVDNLTDRNPTNVTSATLVNIFKYAGANVLTAPAVPAGTIPVGGNSITIPGFLYNVPETGVGIRAIAAGGMALSNSQDTTFNVVAYTGPTSFVWNTSTATAWLTNSNWFGSPAAPPGAAGSVVNKHLASFTSQSTMRLDNIGGVGLNMNTVGGNYNMGAIYMAETYNGVHANGAAIIGNLHNTVSGTLNIHGAPLNSVGGIAGNNHTNLLFGNYMNTSGTTVLDIRNGQGSGSQNMTLNIAAPGSIAIGPGRQINFSVFMTGSSDITVSGGGTLKLTPSGAGSINSYSGAITVANGSLVAGNAGTFRNAAPFNVITLGSAPANNGNLKMNGFSFSLGGLSSAGTGASNTVDNGTVNTTLTINTPNASTFLFGGSLNNGATGVLNLVKSGAGTQTLGGLNNYTGTTTVSAGKLVLARTGGGTIPAGNSISITGGILQISSDQTISNLAISGGTLQVDAGATLTITGTYSTGPGAFFIINNGTIKMQGGALQSFPGSTASVTSMNNLTINNPFGVNMNKNLSIAGVLTLTSGTFTVGAFSLTINNPIAGTPNNLSANQTSSIIIAGTSANVNLPSSVTQLNNLTVSNSQGSTLQGNLNVKNAVLISASAGTVNTGLFTFNGTANLTMNGGNLYMEKNGVVLPEFTGSYNLTGGTVTFAGVGIASDAQTVRPVNYFNLVSDVDGDRILNPSGTIGIANTFTPSTSPYTNAYTITGSTVDFNKGGNQNIPAFKFYHVRFSGGSSFTKSLVGNIQVVNSLIMAPATRLSLGNFNVTLKSDIDLTARVDAVPTANSFVYGGTGGFVVERFIATGVNHGKGWQLLSTPATGQTVKQAWQEGAASVGQNPVSGYGIQITSDLPNATSLGFDIATPSGSGPGMKTYVSSTNSWVGIPNTNVLGIYNKKGYMVFVRGDRSVTSSAQAATEVTLRTTGRIASPGPNAPASTTVNAGTFESVGNPYASAIDFNNLITTSSGIDTSFRVWDPLLSGTYGYGGFQTISKSNAFKPIPGGTANYPTGVPVTSIQSGQAFFVYSTPGGTVNFAESNKIPGSNTVFRQGGQDERTSIRSYLYTSSGNLVDGNLVIVDQAFHNTVGAEDAIKFANFGEGFGIGVQGSTLTLDARRQIAAGDTVHYRIQNLRAQSYQYSITFELFDGMGLEPLLVDRFTGQQHALRISGDNRIDFTVTSDPASRATDRFYIVFKGLRPVPVSYINLRAQRNTDKFVQVQWSCGQETAMAYYQLERSADGHAFTTIYRADATVNNGNTAQYSYPDNDALPGTCYYRIRAIGQDGQQQFSPIVKLTGEKPLAGLQVYPNPVTQGLLQIQFEGQPAGIKGLRLVNPSGQNIWSGSVYFQEGSGKVAINLGTGIAAGIYVLTVQSDGQTIYNERVIVK